MNRTKIINAIYQCAFHPEKWNITLNALRDFLSCNHIEVEVQERATAHSLVKHYCSHPLHRNKTNGSDEQLSIDGEINCTLSSRVNLYFEDPPSIVDNGNESEFISSIARHINNALTVNLQHISVLGQELVHSNEPRADIIAYIIYDPSIRHHQLIIENEKYRAFLQSNPRTHRLPTSIERVIDGFSSHEATRIEEIIESELAPNKYVKVCLQKIDDQSFLSDFRRSKDIVIGTVKTIKSERIVSIALLQAEYELTDKEARLAQDLCRGLNEEQICYKHQISTHTFKTHIKRILKKSQLSSQSRFVAMTLALINKGNL